MAGANGVVGKGGPTKAKSINVVRLVRGKGERVMFTTDRSGRATMANSKGEMTAMSRGDARQRIANLTGPAGGFKVRAPGGRRASLITKGPSAKESKSLDKAIARGQKSFAKERMMESEAKRGITKQSKNQLDALLKRARAA